MRPVSGKTDDQIRREWDVIAETRAHQIDDGVDISARYILPKMIRQLAEGCDFTNVLDIGCGSGFLTSEIAKRARRVVGIDPSRTSIEWANTHHANPNTKFLPYTVDEYASVAIDKSVTLAVANMSLMTVISLDLALQSVSSLVRVGGRFAITMTHPWFWPMYWDYYQEPWFEYNREIVIEAPFKISLDGAGDLVTTHVHRPLERYLECLANVGFVINKVIEPMPDSDIEELYPQKWKYPRFIGVQCTLTG